MNHTQEVSNKGIWLLKIAVIYLLIALGLGLFMAVTNQFQLRSVHTHVNLLGWATLGLAGVVYCLFPKLGETVLARWHFWLHNLGLPVMMGGLAAYHLGHEGALPFIGIGSVTTMLGLALFGINLFTRLEGNRMPVAVTPAAGQVRG